MRLRYSVDKALVLLTVGGQLRGIEMICGSTIEPGGATDRKCKLIGECLVSTAYMIGRYSRIECEGATKDLTVIDS